MALKHFQTVCTVSDESYLCLKESFENAKKKKTWKESITTSTGQRKTVTHRVFDGMVFFALVEHGEDILLINEAIKAKEVKLFGKAKQPLTTKEFVETMQGNFTGNHKGKTHKVRINTAAGQPVRG